MAIGLGSEQSADVRLSELRKLRGCVEGGHPYREKKQILFENDNKKNKSKDRALVDGVGLPSC